MGRHLPVCSNRYTFVPLHMDKAQGFTTCLGFLELEIDRLCKFDSQQQNANLIRTPPPQGPFRVAVHQPGLTVICLALNFKPCL